MGLRGYVDDLSGLLARLVADGILTVADLENTEGQYHELLWMCLASASDDLLTWRACIAGIPTTLEPVSNWVYWLGTRIVWRATKWEDPSRVMGFAREFINRFPEQSGELTLAALSWIASYHPDVRGEGYLKAESITQILALLTGDTIGHIRPEILVGARDWVSEYFMIHGDLLDLSKERLTQMHADRWIDDAQFESAMKTVTELMTQRDHLLASATGETKRVAE